MALDLPPMPGWTAAVVRVIVGGVPAIIVAISGASILFIALFLPRDRRDYALKAADCAFAAARALIGRNRGIGPLRGGQIYARAGSIRAGCSQLRYPSRRILAWRLLSRIVGPATSSERFVCCGVRSTDKESSRSASHQRHARDARGAPAGHGPEHGASPVVAAARLVSLSTGVNRVRAWTAPSP